MPNRTASNRDHGSGSQLEDTDSEVEIERMTTLYKYQPRKKNFYRKSHQRGYDPRYAQVKVGIPDVINLHYSDFLDKTAVRLEMNKCLGISKNEEIIDIELATLEEVESYAKDQQDEPSLKPMRPYLEGKLLVEWNNRLCELFVEHLAEMHDWELTDDVRDVLETAFENRLSTLQKDLRRLENKTQEEIEAMKHISGKQTRASSRRDKVSCKLTASPFLTVKQLWLERRQICLENLKQRDGQIDPGWRENLYMVDKLTMAGMSSDDSEIDNEGRAYYVVKRRAWRSTAVGARLRFIDSQMNRTNASGGIRRGNAPRKRVRNHGAPVSNRDPPTDCPKNYYSREFVSNLSNRAYHALKMKPERELGIID
jgi:hypothetical protein